MHQPDVLQRSTRLRGLSEYDLYDIDGNKVYSIDCLRYTRYIEKILDVANNFLAAAFIRRAEIFFTFVLGAFEIFPDDVLLCIYELFLQSVFKKLVQNA